MLKTYQVTLTVRFEIDVEADSKEEAEKLAEDRIRDGLESPAFINVDETFCPDDFDKNGFPK